MRRIHSAIALALIAALMAGSRASAQGESLVPYWRAIQIVEAQIQAMSNDLLMVLQRIEYLEARVDALEAYVLMANSALSSPISAPMSPLTSPLQILPTVAR